MTTRWLPRLLRRPLAAGSDPAADPEIEAIIACLKAIGPLHNEARARVIRYLAERIEEAKQLAYQE